MKFKWFCKVEWYRFTTPNFRICCVAVQKIGELLRSLILCTGTQHHINDSEVEGKWKV